VFRRPHWRCSRLRMTRQQQYRVRSVIGLTLVAMCSSGLPPPASLKDVWSRQVTIPPGGTAEMRVMFKNDAPTIVGSVLGLALCIDGQLVFRQEFAGYVWRRGPSDAIPFGIYRLAEGAHQLTAFIWYRQLKLREGVYTFAIEARRTADLPPGIAEVLVRVTSNADKTRALDAFEVEFERLAGKVDLRQDSNQPHGCRPREP
jgi:hypothetical protein